MAKSHPRTKETRPAPSTSLVPFVRQTLTHPRFGWYLAGIYGIFMLVIALKYHVVGDYNVETDFFWSYVPQAKDILRGHFIVEDFRGPAYPIVLALVGSISGDFFHTGVVISVLAASIVLFCSFELLKRLFRPDIALIGTLFVAANPTFVQYSYTAGTDMFFGALASLATYFFLRDQSRQWKDLLLAGLFSALAYLTRYNGIVFLAAIPLILLVVNQYQLERKELVRTILVFIGVFLLFIAPWGIFSWIEKGSFFYNKNYLNIAYEMFAKGKIGWDQYWSVDAAKYHSLGQVILADPGLFFSTVLKNVVEHFKSDLDLLLSWKVSVFALLGIATFWKERPTRQQTAFFALGFLYFSILLIVFYGERFSMFLLPFYIALAMRAFSWRGVSTYRFWNVIHVGALASYVILILSVLGAYRYNNDTIASGPKEIPVIADWFKANNPPEADTTYIIARKPHIAYYMGLKLYGFPYVNTIDELRSEVKKTGAKYLFYGYMEAGMRPQFQFLLDPSKAPEWLKAMTYTVQPPAVLYRVEDTP